jgi:hypothetical protein
MVNKYVLGAAVLIAIGLARIAATYTVFNGAYDEPFHVANGMEWLQEGTFTNQYRHPPLAGIVTALGPFVAGLRSPRRWNPAVQGESVIFEEGNEILYSKNDYWSGLTLARIGTLPFFVLACVVTFLWSRRWFCNGFSEASGFWAVLLLICASPILGHAGLATNDVACAATAAFALYRFLRWLEQPDTPRWLWWGFATALAVMCKYSNIPFLGACYLAGFALAPLGPLRRRAAQAGLAACVVLFLMWATYRFTLIPLATVYGPHPRVAAILSSRPLLRSVWNAVMATPLPLTQTILGVRDLYRHNALGIDMYLLGHWSQSGWWYFFPVVLAVKTPIGMLLLAILGCAFILRRWRNAHFEQGWQQVVTAAFPIVILLVCMTARIDLGVRHILPIYPLLAIVGGYAVIVLFRHSRFTAAAAALLLAWVVADSWRAHPDYLAHFNEFAGSHPETILCESDLDWGQDLHRLSERLKQRGVQEFSIAYFGTALLHKAGLPHYEPLSPTQPSRGYIAVSLHHLNIDYKKDGSFAWLKSYTPVERIGKSIDLFYIP